MTFEEVQPEYALAGADFRAALEAAVDLTAQESVHPLPAG